MRKDSTRYVSNKHEKQTAKELGGKVQISSGSSPFFKGDVVLQNCLVECKTCMTPKKSFSIKLEWLDKIREQCIQMRKRFPILAFNFGEGENYYIIDETTMKKFVEFLEQE